MKMNLLEDKLDGLAITRMGVNSSAVPGGRRPCQYLLLWEPQKLNSHHTCQYDAGNDDDEPRHDQYY